MYVCRYVCMSGAHGKSTRMEHSTPTQLINVATKARHLIGVTIFRCST